MNRSDRVWANGALPRKGQGKSSEIMDNIVPFVIFTVIVVSFLKNVLKKINEIKGEPGPGEAPTVARQLRELLQGDEDEEPGAGSPASQMRPSVKPLAQPVARTQPPRPSATPARPVARTQPPRTQPPRPAVAPQPVRPPAPQPLARQARVETPAPAPQTVSPRPIQARPQLEPARQAPALATGLQATPSQSERGKAANVVTQGCLGIPTQHNRGRGRCPRIHLNRRNLGAAQVITEIMNPPMALREQGMPWDM